MPETTIECPSCHQDVEAGQKECPYCWADIDAETDDESAESEEGGEG